MRNKNLKTMNDMTFPIESMIGVVVSYPFSDGIKDVRLVDGEKEFNQPGLSCGFVHFANPNDPKVCLGFGGVDTVYNQIKEINEE